MTGPDEPDALWKEQDKFVDRRSVKVGTSRVIRIRWMRGHRKPSQAQVID